MPSIVTNMHSRLSMSNFTPLLTFDESDKRNVIGGGGVKKAFITKNNTSSSNWDWIAHNHFSAIISTNEYYKRMNG